MKKLLIATVCSLLCMTANAQINDLYIYNTTTCDVFVAFRGDVSGSGCTNGYTSYIKQIPAGASFMVNTGNTTLSKGSLSLTTGDEIVGVEVYDMYGNCTPSIVDTIGESCYSVNTTIATPWTTYKTDCTTCGTINGATWTNAGGGVAKLVFY